MSAIPRRPRRAAPRPRRSAARRRRPRSAAGRGPRATADPDRDRAPGACRTTLSSASCATRNAARSTSRGGRAPVPAARRLQSAADDDLDPDVGPVLDPLGEPLERRSAGPSPRGRSTAGRGASPRPRRPPSGGPRRAARPCRPLSASASARRRDGRTSAWRSAASRPRSVSAASARPASRPGTSSSTNTAATDRTPHRAVPGAPSASRARVRIDRRPQVADEAESPSSDPITASHAHSGTPPRSPFSARRTRNAQMSSALRPMTATHAARSDRSRATPSVVPVVAYAPATAAGSTGPPVSRIASTGVGSPWMGARVLADDAPPRHTRRRSTPTMSATQAIVGAHDCASAPRPISAPSAHRCGTQSEASGAGTPNGLRTRSASGIAMSGRW